MKRLDILYKTIQRAVFSISCLSSLRKRPGKPGELIEKLSEEERTELRNLKSDDIATDVPGIRDKYWLFTMGQEQIQGSNYQTSNLLKSFDEKILKKSLKDNE